MAACALQIEICRGDIREVERIKNVFVGILFLYVHRQCEIDIRTVEVQAREEELRLFPPLSI